MSDFRDRFGAQLAAAAAGLQAAGESDFRDRFGAALALAAADLAGARVPAAAATSRRGQALGRRRRRVLPWFEAGDFRDRFGIALSRVAGELAAAGANRPARQRRWPWLTRPIAVALALTAFAGSAFAAVAIWTPLLGSPQYGYNPGAATSAPPADQLAALAVLRRPQTDADRGALSQAALTYINDYTEGVRTGYVRLLATIGAQAFVLVPVEQRDATATPGSAPATAAPLHNALCIYESDSTPPSTQVGCWSLADVMAGRATSVAEGEVYGLAPDGVASVRFSSPTAPALSAPASGNFFAVALPSDSAPPPAGLAVTFTPPPSG